MSKVPFPPFVDRPVVAKIGQGANRGQRKRTGNTFWHTMVGNLSSTDGWFRHRDSASLTPWGIGGVLDGRLDGVIYRFMDYGTPGAVVPWSSGPWIAPGIGDGKEYVNTFGVGGINGMAEAIENSGLVGTPVSEKQWLSLIWLTAAIIHAGGRDSDEFLWNMHHREICFYSGKDCPFPRIYNYTQPAQAAIVALLKHYEGVPDQKQRHTIGMKEIILPFRASEPIVAPAPKVIFNEFEEDRTYTVGSDGANVRMWGNTDAKILTVLQPGDKLIADGYYHGQVIDGDARWLVQTDDPRGRVHASTLKDITHESP